MIIHTNGFSVLFSLLYFTVFGLLLYLSSTTGNLPLYIDKTVDKIDHIICLGRTCSLFDVFSNKEKIQIVQAANIGFLTTLCDGREVLSWQVSGVHGHSHGHFSPTRRRIL